MILIAVLLPPLSFLIRGKILHAILCFFLQITIIGWLPAAIWAIASLSNDRAERRNKKLIKAMREAR